MRKVISVILISIMILFLPGCGSKSPKSTSETSRVNENTKNPSSTSDSRKKNNILVVYFSMPETSNPDNMTREEENSTVVVDGKVLGNTQYVAQVIKDNTAGDIYRIEPKKPYPLNHDTLVDQAKKEQNEKARPEIAAKVKDMDKYDVIFLGYPNWWGDMPMILYTFLEEYDLSGKAIVPFNTHGGSGFSNTIRTIEKLQPKANVVEDGFTVSRNDVENAGPDIESWLKKIGYSKK